MNKKGILIAIEGVDGCGKATQTDKVFTRLTDEGFNTIKLDYPRYNNASSTFVKMYLSGDFGEKAKEVSPYVASTFYALDRYVSYKQEYENFYKDGGIVVCDRYATANMVHQAGKISDASEREKFLDWLWDYEFNLYKIPVPDLVFFLDVPVEYTMKLMKDRDNKFTGQEKKDIHEGDKSHLMDSYKNACSLVDKYSWERINCVKDDKMRTIEDIHEEIYKIVLDKIQKTRKE